MGSPEAAAGIKLTTVRTARVRHMVEWKQRPMNAKAHLSKKKASRKIAKWQRAGARG